MTAKSEVRDYTDLDWIGRLATPTPLEYRLRKIGEKKLEGMLSTIVLTLKENNLSLEQADAVLEVAKGCIHRESKV